VRRYWLGQTNPVLPHLCYRGCAVNRAIGDRKLLLAIVIGLKEDTLTRAIAYTGAIEVIFCWLWGSSTLLKRKQKCPVPHSH
jgi:hypothetical protein